jgi:hypothetical protein
MGALRQHEALTLPPYRDANLAPRELSSVGRRVLTRFKDENPGRQSRGLSVAQYTTISYSVADAARDWVN